VVDAQSAGHEDPADDEEWHGGASDHRPVGDREILALPYEIRPKDEHPDPDYHEGKEDQKDAEHLVPRGGRGTGHGAPPAESGAPSVGRMIALRHQPNGPVNPDKYAHPLWTLAPESWPRQATAFTG
jgi:hypothetical protein